MENTISRITFADPHTLCRSAIGKLIESFGGLEITAEATNAGELLEILENETPDLLLMDITLPGRSGIEVLHELRRRRKTVRTMILSNIEVEHTIRIALSAGATSFLCKCDATPAELESAIRQTIEGKRYVSSAYEHLRDVQVGSMPANGSDGTDPLLPLSTREKEIFHLLANGLQNSEIAKKLYISPRTVETHRARVVRKLALNSNSELIRYAIKHGLSAV